MQAGLQVQAILKRRKILAHYRRPISDMTLSVRVLRRLETLKVETIGQLCQLSPKDSIYRPVFGMLNLRQVRAELGRLGLALKGEEA